MILFEQDSTGKRKDVCLLHIPKCGGKTLWKILQSQPQTFLVWHNRMFEVPKQPITFFTMLRDPVDRVISTYYYIRRYEADPLHSIVKNMELDEFVSYMYKERYNPLYKKSINIHYRTVNLATRYLTGGKPNKRKKALKNLEKYFIFAGITDMYVESMFFLKELLNLEINKIPNINHTDKRPHLEEIPEDIIQLIMENNQHDIAIYNWAKERLQNKIMQLNAEQKNSYNNWIDEFKSDR
ncbi:sulfotransferase family 2 domain-containing protein [Gracilibacillus oryzae]|uniref:sulfotransferase family 2 domain-containing protein n=1 Tax=Gracilibacillus oryzae TaxID=1672701 RepID=UPI001885D982|nr:sulfotransferase family 2 domain-containing protein [Gracilibacillus oryzae]